MEQAYKNALVEIGVTDDRLQELDLLKALATISMIICHCVLQLGLHVPGYESSIWYAAGECFFGDYLAVAHAIDLTKRIYDLE